MLLARHGGAVRSDLLRYYGVDLLDVFRGTITPDAAYDLVMHLPRDSATQSALADDPDLAGEPVSRSPVLAEFSHEVEALAAVHDVLLSLLATVVSLGGGKPGRMRPYPRPVTAWQRNADAKRRDKHEALVARLLPGR